MPRVFCDEVARVATDLMRYLGWIGQMFVTELTKSLRPAHLDNDAELAYELGQSSVYHISSKKRMDTFLGWMMQVWVTTMMTNVRF
jgi:hypothetical protein